MEQEFFLLLLSILSFIFGFVLDRYGFPQFKKPVDAFLKAIEDGKVEKAELKDILNYLAEAVGEDDNGKTV